MKAKNILFFSACAFFLLFFSDSGLVGYERARTYGHSGLSREMDQAIRLYEAGEDNEAMDRFMQILMKGTPAEKALANEYISKITLRMNATGINYPGRKSEGDPTVSNMHEEKPEETVHAPGEENYDVPLGERNVRTSRPRGSRKLAEMKIKEKIKELRNSVLLELNNTKGVKVYMKGDYPQALSVDSRALFSKETSFNPKAPRILSLMAGLIFTMGKHHCLILPEGSIEDNVRITGIRRALAINSYLLERGISSARLDVNLIGEEVNVPNNLRDVKGILLLFSGDLVPNLRPPDEKVKNKPQISMGIYPTVIKTYKNEGAIIEFAVYETPFAEPTWKFQIFQIRDRKTMFLIQEISGTGATYHQSFWNGRKDFFGEAYPPGQYVFSLRAYDAQGREAMVRKLLVIQPKQGKVRKKKKINVRTLKKTARKSADVSGKWKKYSLQGGREAPEEVARAGKTQPQKKVSLKASQGGEDAEYASHVTYKIYFRKGARSITENSDKKLLQVANNMNFYPMARIKVIGYVYSGDPGSKALAQERVNYIVSRLAGKYGIEKSRMKMDTQESEIPVNMVEIKMLGNQ